jgi:hypothetical protein
MLNQYREIEGVFGPFPGTPGELLSLAAFPFQEGLPQVYQMELPAGYPVIHHFRGNSVENRVHDLWETGSGGG